MRIFIITAALVTSVMLAGCMSASSTTKAGYDFAQLDRVAVVDVTSDRLNDSALMEISDLFAAQLLRNGYSVIERSQIQQILDEQNFQTSGVTTDADAVRAGKILNTDAVMIVNAPVVDNKIQMTAKLIEVETGSLLWIADGTASTKRGLTTVGGALLGAAAGAVIGHQIDSGAGSVIGGIAGGAAGGFGGYALEPDAKKLLRKLVGKMSEEMPSRMMVP